MSLAVDTSGVYARPAEDPANAGFDAHNDPTIGLVDDSVGLIARSGHASDPGPDIRRPGCRQRRPDDPNALAPLPLEMTTSCAGLPDRFT